MEQGKRPQAGFKPRPPSRGQISYGISETARPSVLCQKWFEHADFSLLIQKLTTLQKLKSKQAFKSYLLVKNKSKQKNPVLLDLV